MPRGSKKQKSNTSTAVEAEEEYDAKKFVSLAAQKRYLASVVKKGAIQERGLYVSMDSVSQQVKRRKWEELVKHPEAAVVPLVREFYANMKEHRNFRVFVRGKMVPFDRTTINRYYKLSNIENDAYERMLEGSINWDTIKDALCPGTVTYWDRNQRGVVKTFPGKNMSKSSKAWHYFVCSKFMPTTNFSAVAKDRAGLTYAIQMGKSVDVGLVIQKSILNALKIAKAGLPHPHLITELCKRVGVEWGEGEELLHPKWAINDKTLDVYKVHSTGEGTSGAGCSSAGPVTPTKPKTPTQRMSHIESQLKYMMEYQQCAVQYQGELAAALMGAFNQCALYWQITDPLPVLPSFNPPPHLPSHAEESMLNEERQNEEEEDDQNEESSESSTDSENEEE